ncbi:MAG TPA: helix-turn-helix domain-containing protein [Jiangellaceae bacterium]|nr:helix-turn-helix domain-containing protein [Jiangellaceae bacterium]
MDDGPVTQREQRVRPVAADHTMVLHHPSGQTIKEHSHPAWNLVIPQAGRLTWTAGRGAGQCAAGAVFPPQVAHRTSSAAAHASVFIDPWHLGLGPGSGRPIALEGDTVRHLRAHWSPDQISDPDQSARETVALLRRRHLLPAAVSIDPRVAAAVRVLATAESVADIAAGVGLSPSRLRALIHAQTGTPPTRLRMWQRLRAAILSLPATPIALAAIDAGFADQAHLTRTATRLLGQTPGDLAHLLGNSQRRRHHHDNAALAAAA